MGAKLIDLFKNKVSKTKDKDLIGKADFEVMYPTGFLALDYLNGTMIHVDAKGIKEDYNSIGIVDGSSNTFIGRSGCGKSTLVTQIIGNTMKQFPNAECYIDDIEGSLPMARKAYLLGLSESDLENRVIIRSVDITTESIYKRIKAIHDLKIENRKDFEYDTGLYDLEGNRMIKMVPTFYFIDSFAMLMSEDVVNENEIEQNGMGASSIAKMNTQLIKKISQLLRGANIILFTINHIMDDIQIGFMPKPVQIAGLKQGERLPGGRTALYLANNLFRLDEKTTLKPDEGYGISGKIVDITLIKSRTNATRKSIPLVFNMETGSFDQVLSLYHFLKNEGMVGGAGRSMFFNDFPDIKFSQKEFKEKLQTDTELQKAFAITAKQCLVKLLSDTKIQKSEEESAFDINSAVLGII